MAKEVAKNPAAPNTVNTATQVSTTFFPPNRSAKKPISAEKMIPGITAAPCTQPTAAMETPNTSANSGRAGGRTARCVLPKLLRVISRTSCSLRETGLMSEQTLLSESPQRPSAVQLPPGPSRLADQDVTRVEQS